MNAFVQSKPAGFLRATMTAGWSIFSRGVSMTSNLGTMVVWAALMVVLTLFGMATHMLGLIIVMPELGYATWHAYREVVR